MLSADMVGADSAAGPGGAAHAGTPALVFAGKIRAGSKLLLVTGRCWGTLKADRHSQES